LCSSYSQGYEFFHTAAQHEVNLLPFFKVRGATSNGNATLSDPPPPRTRRQLCAKSHKVAKLNMFSNAMGRDQAVSAALKAAIKAWRKQDDE
jgi:hypothetical protein